VIKSDVHSSATFIIFRKNFFSARGDISITSNHTIIEFFIRYLPILISFLTDDYRFSIKMLATTIVKIDKATTIDANTNTIRVTKSDVPNIDIG
jgi:hypothetical protein